MTLSVLHISDLHRDPKNPIGNKVLLDSLERDRDRYATKEEPCIAPPNIIIVSGDIIQGVLSGTPGAEAELQRQYDEALSFLSELADRFVDGIKDRVIVVPGNHDVSDHQFRQCLMPINMAEKTKKVLVTELFQPDSPLRWSWEEFALYEIVDWDSYHQRLAAFADFYSKFYDGKRTYSIDPAEQVDIFDFPDFGIVVAGFCSCHNNDLLNRQGSIHPEALATAGKKLRNNTLPNEPLRLAVWHHNTEGPPIHVDYMDPDIVQNMIDSGFSLGLHGHQHKPQFLDTRFRHGLDRRITVVSAGTLCGGAAFGHGRAYNVVEIDTEKAKGRLHIREMQNDNLQMPIWGARSLPPNREGFLEFTFDPPPEPFVRPSRSTVNLTKAQSLFDSGEYRDAAELLLTMVRSDPLARRMLLECLVRLGDHAKILATFDPPESPAEAIALMDAFWANKEKERLSKLLALPLIADSSDPSVIELRNKYIARLKK